MRVTVLGSGTSHGVPMIGCECAVCMSTDPRDKRTRPSIVVELPTGTILVDTAPELRLQAVAHKVRRVDAVLFTHTHADHVHGIDDLRAYNARQRGAIPLYGSPASMEDIRVRFDYIFAQSYLGGGLPLLDLHPVEGPFAVLGHTVVPVVVLHGQLPVYGYRFGRFAYVTDCSAIPAPSMALLRDLDVLILDALRHKPHPTHFNIAQALEAIAALQPRQAFLTHLTHDVSHRRVAGELPEGVELAYDGLVFEVEWGPSCG
jgi:phosphoribosyl 1,2-cyclic phosphate phosphodiesterase